MAAAWPLLNALKLKDFCEARPRGIPWSSRDYGLAVERFSLYQGNQPLKWHKVLQMTDVAFQTPETSRRTDAIDRKILMVLQEDASLSVAEIGDRVGLS